MWKAERVSTPSLTFSLGRLKKNAIAFREICLQTFHACGYEVYFPLKVAPSKQIATVLWELGFGLEVISHSTSAIADALSGTRKILSGPAKTASLVAQNIETAPWNYISCESLTDLKRVNDVAAQHETSLPVLLRIKATSKRRLGMSIEDARSAVGRASAYPALKFVGLHIHSGSNLTEREADLMFERMKSAAHELIRSGLQVQVLNIGGGLPCIEGRDVEIRRRLKDFASLAGVIGARVLLEPGRALVGDAAELISEVIDVRPSEGELTINTAAYVVHGPCNADRFVVHKSCADRTERRYEVVKRKDSNFRIGGIWPVEGDSLWLDVPLPRFEIGDLIVFPHAGAYTLGFLSELSFDKIAPLVLD